MTSYRYYLYKYDWSWDARFLNILRTSPNSNTRWYVEYYCINGKWIAGGNEAFNDIENIKEITKEEAELLLAYEN